MYDFPVALQLYSIRDDMEKDFKGTLKKVKDLGYDGVEFAGLYNYSADEVKKICANIGLNPISAHVPFVDMINDPEILSVYKEIGCKFVVIPYLTEEYRPGQPKFKEVIEGAKILGEKANELGLKLCYHNHDFEFTKINNEYALDILYKEVSSELLFTQLDTCWVNIGGENPSDYLLKYKGRADILHLKDFVGSKTADMYELIGIDGNKNQADSEKFDFRPLGLGLQDFPAILAAAKEAGTKWLVIEQDQPSLNKSPLECAEISIKYLRSIL